MTPLPPTPLPPTPLPPAPEQGTAAVALVATTAEVLAHPELGERLLAPWERRRLAGIRVPARRDDVVAARLLLRLCASRVTGLPPDAVERRPSAAPDAGGTGTVGRISRTTPGWASATATPTASPRRRSGRARSVSTWSP